MKEEENDEKRTGKRKRKEGKGAKERNETEKINNANENQIHARGKIYARDEKRIK